jgi:hypothetical protein
VSRLRVLVGLIGANIQGSMSPALFADAFAAAGVDGYYHLLDVDHLPGLSLPQLVDAIKAAGFAGANVTYPFKQEIIPLLDAVGPEAAQVGAVNTVAIAPDGRTTGYNFDRRDWRNSFVESLGREHAYGKTVVQIGAGSAGGAVAWALMDRGVAVLVLHDLDAGRPTRSRTSCRRITAPHVAASPATSSATSRTPTASSTPRTWACAAFPAVPFRWRRSRPCVERPTSSIRPCRPPSSRRRPRPACACSTAAGCACTSGRGLPLLDGDYARSRAALSCVRYRRGGARCGNHRLKRTEAR